MRRLILPLVVMALVVGCKKRTSSTITSRGPATTQHAAPAPLPATRPASILSINGKNISFPSAKLVLTTKSAGVQAILCSDDPPAAIDPNYTGNSYMLEMAIDIDTPAELTSATWTYQAPNQSPRNSATGIFLTGSKQQLQPLDVKVTFAKEGDDILASVDGKFLMFDTRDIASPTQVVNVTGKLDAVVSER